MILVSRCFVKWPKKPQIGWNIPYPSTSKHGAIPWRSKLQECTGTTMNEVEYVGAFDAVKEALWLGRLACTFRQVNFNSAPIFFSDNQEVVALAKNLVHHNASKCIEVRYHFIQDSVTKGKLVLEKISTGDNVAYGMTKCLSANSFR